MLTTEIKGNRYSRQSILGMLLIVVPFFANGAAPLRSVDYVDLERFMGRWYVIACIPTLIERNIFNAVETYRLNKNGTIATTFAFQKGGFDGPRREFHPRGFVQDKDTNAIWGMQFFWPLKADYRIIHVDSNYTNTIIGRKKRDYVWVMSREPKLDSTTYQTLVNKIAAAGYDIDDLILIPQRWP